MRAGHHSIVEALETLGLERDEAEAYLHLIAIGSATVGKLSMISGHSRTKVYSILDNLVIKGFIEVISDRPRIFAPVPVDEVLQRKKKEFDEAMAILERDLVEYYMEHQGPQTRMITYRGWAVLKKVREMLMGAEKTIKIITAFIPDEITESIINTLENVIKPDVKIMIILSEDLKDGIKLDDRIMQRATIKWRSIPRAGWLIVDDREMLFGGGSATNRTGGINSLVAFWTENRELTEFACVLFDQVFSSGRGSDDIAKN